MCFFCVCETYQWTVWISLQAHGPCTYRSPHVPQCSLWNSTCSAYWLWTFHWAQPVDRCQSFRQFLSNGASLLVVGTGLLWPRVGHSWRRPSIRGCVPTHQLYNDQWAEHIQEFDPCKVQLIIILPPSSSCPVTVDRLRECRGRS